MLGPFLRQSATKCLFSVPPRRSIRSVVEQKNVVQRHVLRCWPPNNFLQKRVLKRVNDLIDRVKFWTVREWVRMPPNLANFALCDRKRRNDHCTALAMNAIQRYLIW